MKVQNINFRALLVLVAVGTIWGVIFGSQVSSTGPSRLQLFCQFFVIGICWWYATVLIFKALQICNAGYDLSNLLLAISASILFMVVLWFLIYFCIMLMMFFHWIIGVAVLNIFAISLPILVAKVTKVPSAT